jgi:hypothetical protein
MPLITADVGAQAILAKYFNSTAPVGGNDLVLKLFTNDVDPMGDSTTASFVEAVGGGYTSKSLLAGSFTVSIVASIPQAVYARQTFIFTGALTGPQNIYGYYVVDADGVLVWAERGGAVFTPELNSDRYLVDPLYQLSKGTPT